MGEELVTEVGLIKTGRWRENGLRWTRGKRSGWMVS